MLPLDILFEEAILKYQLGDFPGWGLSVVCAARRSSPRSPRRAFGNVTLAPLPETPEGGGDPATL